MKRTLFNKVELGRKKIWKIILPILLTSAILASSITTAIPVFAATITSTASGGYWNATTTWSGGVVPGSGDTVTIAAGATVTVTANASCASLTFNNTNTATATLNVNASVTLTVTGAITLQNAASASTAAALAGTGVISCASISVGGTTAPSGYAANRAAVLSSTILTLTVTNNLTITGQQGAIGNAIAATFNLNSGSVSVGGNVNLTSIGTNYGFSASTLDMTKSPGSGTLTVSGTTPISTANDFTISLNGNAATVNYSGAAQNIYATTYHNLTLSGSGVNTLQNGIIIRGNLAIIGSAQASINNGLNISVNTLALGGVSKTSGTWGSSSSSATNKNDTYFAATTGYLTVASGPSNDATVTSGTYTVSALSGGAGTITNVPSGTTKTTLEANLVRHQANQTWNDSGIHDPVVSGDTLVVTAQDGTTKATYTITVNTVLSNDATVTSGTYAVSALSGGAGTITNVPSGTTKTTLKANLVRHQANQTWNDSGIHDPVVSGDTLVVKAQDGTTQATYTITVNSVPAAPTVLSAATNVTGDTITITFSKVMVNPMGDQSQFKYEINSGADQAFGAAALHSGDNTKIDLATSGTAIVSGNMVTLKYTVGTLVAADGGVLASFSGQAVTNNIPIAAPTITGISPTSGSTAGGTNVIITGTGFANGATAKIGGILATGISVVSATSITAIAPAGTAGAQDVVVTNPDTQYGTLAGGFTYSAPASGGGFGYVPPAPTVASISPTSGPAAGSTSVTITGTGFVSGATVMIGSAAATDVSVVSATSITATIPPGTAGAQDVVVTNPGNQSGTMAKGFTYVPPAPIVTSISPTSGPVAGGTSVTITGTGFASGATVTIGGTAATGVNVVSATSITVTIPPGTAGAQDVVVTNVGNQFGTMARGFTYVPPVPTVASISPASGPTAGGTSVTITGTGFASGATVMIGGAAATGVSVVGTKSITATIPPGTAGTQDVVVTNPDNQLATMAKGFSYVAPAPAGQTAVSQFVTGNGIFTQAVTVSSVDTAVVLTIAQDIQGLANSAKPLSFISITPMKVPQSPLPGQSIVGMAYNVGPEGATFNKPVTLTFHYDPNQLPAGANNNNLTVAVWDLTNNSWVGITSVVDPAAHTVTAQVTHFSGYVVLIPSRPAAFAVSNLSISPLNINVGMVVTISAVVTNQGDLSGNYQVSLKINNVQVDAKDVTLAGNASQTVVFSTATNTTGNHIIDVNGEVSAFTVKAVSATTSVNLILIGGVIAFFAGFCLAISREVVRKRRKSAQLPE